MVFCLNYEFSDWPGRVSRANRSKLEDEVERIRAQDCAIYDEVFASDAACRAAPLAIRDAVSGGYSVSAPLTRFRGASSG